MATKPRKLSPFVAWERARAALWQWIEAHPRQEPPRKLTRAVRGTAERYLKYERKHGKV